jgi:hypothetical protein
MHAAKMVTGIEQGAGQLVAAAHGLEHDVVVVLEGGIETDPGTVGPDPVPAT